MTRKDNPVSAVKPVSDQRAKWLISRSLNLWPKRRTKKGAEDLRRALWRLNDYFMDNSTGDTQVRDVAMRVLMGMSNYAP